MSILEVVVALAILATSLIGMAEYQRRYSRSNANSSMLNTAIDLATARLERVKAERTYAAIDTMAITESNLATLDPSYANYVRTTTITRTSIPASVDYKVITVTVTHPSMPLPVKKTSAIASF
jgi:Tfp pilus assembly protein PilV